MKLKIYDREIQDGLADAFQNNTIAYCSLAKPIEMSQVEEEKQRFLLKGSANANPNQLDLFYLNSILASVGWNANDDVFDKFHMWAARNTPVDKPFNYEHNESDIIGHITSSLVYDINGKEIPSNASLDDLPSQFDIVVGSVLYKSWQDENLQARMDKLIAEIGEGKWFISMECLFPDFDYAVITPDGQHKVVARTRDTAFLSKHLRFYGGSGEYQGHKLGRLLKNFLFSGKGLVSNPANKRSLILNSNSFEGTYASSNLLREKVMQEQLDKLMAENKALADEVKALREAHEKTVANEVQSVKTKLADSEKVVADLQKQVVDNKNLASVKDEEITKLTAKVVELNEALSKAQTELQAVANEKIKADRLAKLVKVVSQERADELVKKFESVDDSVFEELVQTLASTSKVTDKTVADTTDLEDAKLKAQAALGVNPNETVELQKAAASWIASALSTVKTQK